MEIACEGRFEAKRRLGPPYKPGCKEWATATNIDHVSQVVKALRESRVQKTSASVSDTPASVSDTSNTKGVQRNAIPHEKVAAENETAMIVAMRLLALCCPTTMPGATREHVENLMGRYRDWWKGREGPMEEEDASDNSGESDDEGQEEEEDEVKDEVLEAAGASEEKTTATDPFKVVAEKAQYEQFLDSLMATPAGIN